MHRFTSSDIASTFPPDKQMGWIRDPQGGPGTQPLCSVLISCSVKDWRWKSDWVVEISRFTGDNRLSIGKRAHVRNSSSIRTSYWPVAYDPRPAQYAWYWAASGEARQLPIYMQGLSLVLLTQQQWIFTCLLTCLIGFSNCTHSDRIHCVWGQDAILFLWRQTEGQMARRTDVAVGALNLSQQPDKLATSPWQLQYDLICNSTNILSLPSSGPLPPQWAGINLWTVNGRATEPELL